MAAGRLLLLCAAAMACGREVPRFDQPPFAREPPGPGDLGGRLLVTNNGDDTLSVLPRDGIGPAGRVALGFNPVDPSGPHHAVVDPAGRQAYVLLSFSVTLGGAHAGHGTSTIPGYVVKLDARDARVLGVAELEPDPGDCALSPDGARLYVVHHDLLRWSKGAEAGDLRQGDSNLLVLDTASLAVTRRVPLCPAAQGVRLSADGQTLYAACGPDEIAVLDLSRADAKPRLVPLLDSQEASSCKLCPDAVAVAPDGRVWVSLLGDVSNHDGHPAGGIMVYDPRLGAFGRDDFAFFHGSAMSLAFQRVGDGYRAVVPRQGHADAEDAIVTFTEESNGLFIDDTLPLSPDVCILPTAAMQLPDGEVALLCEGDHTRPGSVVWLSPELVPAKRAATGVGSDGFAYVPAGSK